MRPPAADALARRARCPAPPPPEAREPPLVELPRPARPVEPVAAPPPPPAAPASLRRRRLRERRAPAARLRRRGAACAHRARPPASRKPLFAGRDPARLADEIGAALRLTTDNLDARWRRAGGRPNRRSAPLSTRCSDRPRTTRSNSPPTPSTRWRSCSGRRAASISRPRRRSREVFDESKTPPHAQTFGAMQGALDALFEDLSPTRSTPPAAGARPRRRDGVP